ncbi:hypothetical protein GCM10023322_23270 [Rugosimonospora acidiphila]|uniref:Uncharacterized protein n=1 Tax=Rugosimonospora acidiphila TaxID=556531 RepID=A0ABP9RPL6_9ACTN
MSDQQSPWAKPESEDSSSPVTVVYPPSPPAATRLDARPGRTEWSRSGTITQLNAAPPAEPDVIQFGKPKLDPAARQRRTLLWFGGSAGLIVVLGAVILLVLSMSGSSPLQRAAGPSNVLPPLAKACPPPSADPQNLPSPPPPPPGPRTVDTQSGISYAAQGAPWQPWNQVWTAGDLHVKYGVGQHFVTETYPGGDYHASILSGNVPAAENDALTLDLKCTGHQVLADVRASYYPQPTTMDTMRDEVTNLGGRPAWVSEFRLHFHSDGLKASSELVGLALIDVGRPNAAVLYVSIPNTVSQFDPVVNQVLESVRPT